MVTQGANVRRGVLVVSSLMLTLEVVAFVLTIVLYLYATSETHGNFLAKHILKTLYPYHYRALRRSYALEFHILVSGAVQLLLMLPTILMIIGASSRIRFLLLPWLIVFGMLQVAVLAAIFFVIYQLPEYLKLISVGIAGVETFVLFPWWFSVIHLFAVFSKEEELVIAEANELYQSAILNTSTNAICSYDDPNTPNWMYGRSSTRGSRNSNSHKASGHNNTSTGYSYIGNSSVTARINDI